MDQDETSRALYALHPVEAPLVASQWDGRLDYPLSRMTTRRYAGASGEVLWKIEIAHRSAGPPPLLGAVLIRGSQLWRITRYNLRSFVEQEAWRALLDAAGMLPHLEAAAATSEFEPAGDDQLIIGFGRHDWPGEAGREFSRFFLQQRLHHNRLRAAPRFSAARAWTPDMFDGDAAKIMSEALASKERREDGRWRQLEPEHDAATLAGLHDALAEMKDFELPGESDSVIMRMKPLSFYDAYDCFEIEDRRSARPRKARLLFGERPPGDLPRIVPLDGVVNPIHDVNKTCALRLESGAILEYLSFFCENIGAQGNPFPIIQSIDDLRWRRHGKRAEELLAKHVFPLRHWPGRVPFPDGIDPESSVLSMLERKITPLPGSHLADGLCLHASSLHHSIFAVHPSGFVQMLEDTVILRRLPVQRLLQRSDSQFALKGGWH